MPGSSRLFWVVACTLLIAASVTKAKLNASTAESEVLGLAAARISLDTFLDAEKGPRLLIAGGSNAASGFDSLEITKATGFPTFNLSLLNEGYDYRNLFAVVESRSRAGDIVILSTARAVTYQPSPAARTQVRIGQDLWSIPQKKRFFTLGAATFSVPLAPMFGEQSLLRALLTWFQRGGRSEPALTQENLDRSASDQFSIAALPGYRFNERGDWVNCDRSTYPEPMRFDPELLLKSKTYLTELNDFAEVLQQRSVVLKVTSPTVLVQAGMTERWSHQYRQLVESLPTVDFLPLDSERQLLTDSSKFCDTNTHLLRSQIAANNQAIVALIQRLQEGR